MHLFGVGPSGFIELLGAGWEAAPVENGHWGATGGEFQLFHGAYRPMGFGRYRGVRAFILAGLTRRVY